jgi:hypothetical protein
LSSAKTSFSSQIKEKELQKRVIVKRMQIRKGTNNCEAWKEVRMLLQRTAVRATIVVAKLMRGLL